MFWYVSSLVTGMHYFHYRNEGIDTTDDSIPEKRRSRVRKGIKSVYRKAKQKLNRAPSQTDSVMGDSESQDSISIKSNPETRSEAAKRKLSSVARAILTAQKMRDEVSPEVQSKSKKMEDKEDASIPEYSTSNTLWRNKDYVNFIVKAQCLKITQNVAFEFLNFGIFHQFLAY